MKQVVISVRGGVAEIAYASDGVEVTVVDFDDAIAYASDGVEVTVVDFDDAEAEGKSDEHKLWYWIARLSGTRRSPTLAVKRRSETRLNRPCWAGTAARGIHGHQRH